MESKMIVFWFLFVVFFSVQLMAAGDIPSGKPIEWYLQNGEDFYQKGEFASAVAYFEKVLEIDAQDPVAAKRVRQCLDILKGSDGERKYETYLLRANNFLKKGETVNALLYYLAALKAQPGNEAVLAEKFKAAAEFDKTAWTLFLTEHREELEPLFGKGLVPAAESSVTRPVTPTPAIAAAEKFDFQTIEGVACERKNGILSASENGIDFKYDKDKKPPIHIPWDTIEKIEGAVMVQKGYKPMAGITIEAHDDKFKLSTSTSAFELLEFRYLVLEYWEKKINKKNEDEFVLEELDKIKAKAIEKHGPSYGKGKIIATKKGLRFSGENEFYAAWSEIKKFNYYGESYDSYVEIFTGDKQGIECKQSGGVLFNLGGALNWLWGKYKDN